MTPRHKGDLSQCPVDLSDFRFNDTSKTFEFDVQGSKVVYAFKGEQQLDLNLLAGDWTETDLIRWLDKELRQPDIRQAASLGWLPALCSPTLDAQGIRFGVAGALKFILVRKLAEKRDECRTFAYNAGYQEMLFGPNAAPETSFDFSFRYDPQMCTRPSGFTVAGIVFLSTFTRWSGSWRAAAKSLIVRWHWTHNRASSRGCGIWLSSRIHRFGSIPLTDRVLPGFCGGAA